MTLVNHKLSDDHFCLSSDQQMQFYLYNQLGSCLQNFLYYRCGLVIRILNDTKLVNYVSFHVFEGTSGIHNQYTTMQFTGEVSSYIHLCFFISGNLIFFLFFLSILLKFEITGQIVEVLELHSFITCFSMWESGNSIKIDIVEIR